MASQYHFNVIYNDAKTHLSSTPDTDLSLKFTKLLVRNCNPHRWRSYYKDRDLLPGQNIFEKLTGVINDSKFIIIIFTEGFVRDCWSTYHRQTALKILIDQKRVDKLIPILVGVDTLPDDLGSFHPVSFSKNSALWESDTSVSAWSKVIQRLEGMDTYNSTNGDAHGHVQEVQETRDHQLRPELLNISVPGSNPTVERFESERGDAAGLVAQPTATIESNNCVASASQQTSMSLSESPIIRPPPSITPSQPGPHPVPDQNLFSNVHPHHTAESTNTSTSRQFSLSQDQDLQSDYISVVAKSQLVSPSTDSGYSTVEPALSASNSSLCTTTPVEPESSASNTSLYTTTPDSSEADDFIDRKRENLAGANVADTEVLYHRIESSKSTDNLKPVNTQGEDGTQSNADGLDIRSKNECQDSDRVSGNVLITKNMPPSVVTEETKKQESEMSQVHGLPKKDKDTIVKKDLCSERSLMRMIVSECLSWLTKAECAYRG